MLLLLDASGREKERETDDVFATDTRVGHVIVHPMSFASRNDIRFASVSRKIDRDVIVKIYCSSFRFVGPSDSIATRGSSSKKSRSNTFFRNNSKILRYT